MIAGRMKSLIEVFRPNDAKNPFGETERTWEKVGTWHAQRASLSGTRVSEADELFADYRARYYVRIAHRPSVGWRLTGDDGQTYEITSLIPNKSRGMLAIDCQRVNL